LACEQAGRESDARIENSDGASVGTGESIGVYANSHGFIGRERSTQHSLGCALIAGRGDAMQRDGWYSIGLSADDLESAATIGRKAAATCGIAPGAATDRHRRVSGAVLQRDGALADRPPARCVSRWRALSRASFLVDAAGTQLFPDWFAIDELPFLPRGFRSSSFDAEGVATVESPLVKNGVLQRYILSSYSARKLGLTTTANAGGVHNLQVEANAGDFESMLRGMGRGLLVTELMGQGVNTVTGDYSRGAAVSGSKTAASSIRSTASPSRATSRRCSRPSKPSAATSIRARMCAPVQSWSGA
jgi:PmbA protein